MLCIRFTQHGISVFVQKVTSIRPWPNSASSSWSSGWRTVKILLWLRKQTCNRLGKQSTKLRRTRSHARWSPSRPGFRSGFFDRTAVRSLLCTRLSEQQIAAFLAAAPVESVPLKASTAATRRLPDETEADSQAASIGSVLRHSFACHMHIAGCCCASALFTVEFAASQVR